MDLNHSVNEWLSTLGRVVGLMGLIYEVVIDKFQHPEAMGIFGGIYGLPYIFPLTASLRKQRREESDLDGGEAP